MFKNKILYLIKLSLIIIASNVAIYSNSFALFTYQGDVEPSNINELNGSIFFSARIIYGNLTGCLMENWRH